jgi:hypothetical protein
VLNGGASGTPDSSRESALRDKVLIGGVLR